MLLLCIVKFGPTAQICAKTPKSETPFSLFSRTHARGLLMAHSTRFFPPIAIGWTKLRFVHPINTSQLTTHNYASSCIMSSLLVNPTRRMILLVEGTNLMSDVYIRGGDDVKGRTRIKSASLASGSMTFDHFRMYVYCINGQWFISWPRFRVKRVN